MKTRVQILTCHTLESRYIQLLQAYFYGFFQQLDCRDYLQSATGSSEEVKDNTVLQLILHILLNLMPLQNHRSEQNQHSISNEPSLLFIIKTTTNLVSSS